MRLIGLKVPRFNCCSVATRREIILTLGIFLDKSKLLKYGEGIATEIVSVEGGFCELVCP